ncbi:hypothetical protein ElyMa_004322400 [Elysia marginata]|uniref:Uncharacterized protein n=1 Tax=Elysia marginata TaxID=1093978 RepID=A0AAV4H3S7_9GAST|nr:hypothetical protein ElyMa_004322400 [Elysia marginata]
MSGMNTCQWLVMNSTELCGRSCRATYCKVHLARLRKGPGTTPCYVCGKGVRNRYRICISCGYHRVQTCDWHRRERALNAIFKAEFKRLAAIDISI